MFQPCAIDSCLPGRGDAPGADPGDVAALLDLLAATSSRPRYAFMVLNLIAEIAGPDGRAGPFVPRGQGLVALRDWLGDSLTPMGGRDPRRLALAARVRAELARAGQLADDPATAARQVDGQVRERVLASAKANLSRAVSELVRAGLLRRHYAGYRVDHRNRGGQRHVVYTIIGGARCLLGRKGVAPVPPAPVGVAPALAPSPARAPRARIDRRAGPAQGELALN